MEMYMSLLEILVWLGEGCCYSICHMRITILPDAARDVPNVMGANAALPYRR